MCNTTQSIQFRKLYTVMLYMVMLEEVIYVNHFYWNVCTCTSKYEFILKNNRIYFPLPHSFNTCQQRSVQ